MHRKADRQKGIWPGWTGFRTVARRIRREHTARGNS